MAAITKIILFFLLLQTLLIISGCRIIGGTENSFGEFRDKIFLELEEIRETRSDKIHKWLIERKTQLNNNDIREELTSFFTETHSIVYSNFDRDKFLQINSRIEEFFVYQLGTFYDLLFINSDGQIFYSVKMEDDFQSNLFNGPYSDSLLAKRIQQITNGIKFIDFEYYQPSDEAASFYIFPINHKGKKGWIAAQLSINQINRLLIDRTGLGTTGEVYLVNEQQLMLTESRFIEVDTVLSKKIDTEAASFSDKTSGKNVIKDYRNIDVLSTYKKFQFEDSYWKLVVEKDEDEVITDYYKKNKKKLFPLLTKMIKEHTEKELETTEPFKIDDNIKKVDMGELIRSGSKKPLITYGVLTCTAVTAYSGNNDFVYMTHLSPLDLSYNPTKKEQDLFGDSLTDLTSLLIRRILYFEIKPYQIKDLTFIITATHTESLMNIIDSLLDHGILLSQIKAGILENGGSVNLYSNNESAVSVWNYSGSKMYLDYNKIESLGVMLHNL